MSTWCVNRSHLAVIGASSETGYGTTGYTSTDDGYTPTRYGWVARVERNASAEWGTVTTNYAHNGSLITDYYPGGRWPDAVGAVDDIQQKQPGIVLMQLLVNEYVNNVDPATAEANLRDLISRVRTAVSGVDILLMTYPDIKWPDAPRPWTDYAPINHRVATDMGCGLIDLRQYIDSPDTNGAAGVWHSDGAHLLDAGQAAESAAVWSLLWMWVQTC